MRIEVTKFDYNDYVIEVERDDNLLLIEADSLEKVYRDYSCIVRNVWRKLDRSKIISLYDSIDVETIPEEIFLNDSPMYITTSGIEVKMITEGVKEFLKHEFPDIYKIIENIPGIDFMVYGKNNVYTNKKFYVSADNISICGDTIEEIISKYKESKKLLNTYKMLSDVKIDYEDTIEISGLLNNIYLYIHNPPKELPGPRIKQILKIVEKYAKQTKLYIASIKVDFSTNEFIVTFTNYDNSEYYTITNNMLDKLPNIVKNLREIKKKIKDLDVISYDNGDINITTQDISVSSNLSYYSIILTPSNINEFDHLIKLINRNKYVHIDNVKHEETDKLIKLYNFLMSLKE